MITAAQMRHQPACHCWRSSAGINAEVQAEGRLAGLHFCKADVLLEINEGVCRRRSSLRRLSSQRALIYGHPAAHEL